MEAVENVNFRVLMSKEELQEDWQTDDRLQLVTRDSVQPSEALGDARFIEVVAVVIAGTLATFALKLTDRWLKRNEAGSLVDLSKDPYEISFVRSIPHGMLVVIDKNGNTTVHRSDAKEPDALQSLILEALRRAPA